MTGHNANRLKPLKQRLTKAQQFKRRERMKIKGTWRQQMETGVARGFGAMAQANNTNARRVVFIQRYNLALDAVMILAIIFLMGKIFGWW